MREKLQDIDALIRSGQTGRAAILVNDLAKSIEPRKERLVLAKLARRSFVPTIGLNLLRPFVRPSPKEPAIPLPAEVLEYAACLVWMDALPEAFELLGTLDHRKLPDVDLIMALALFAEWRYAEAIPHLLRYIEKPEVEEYWRLVAKVNLLAAYVHEKCFGEVSALVDKLESEARKQDRLLLLSNILQMKAENEVHRKNWQAAECFVEEALQFTEKLGRVDTLFAMKWKAVIEFYKTGNVKCLIPVREKALALQHWETLRDCDFHELSLTQDLALGSKLFFGTPFRAFRERILQTNPWLAEVLPKEYFWQLGIAGVFEPCESFKEGQLLERLFNALASDFYKPQTLGDLHSKVFPWKHYHPIRSADSVHQGLKRLRAELRPVGLSIIETQSTYSLHGNITVKINRDKPTLKRRVEATGNTLAQKFGRREFSAEEAARALSLSRNGALLYLRELVKNEALIKISSGPRTRYSFSSLNCPFTKL